MPDTTTLQTPAARRPRWVFVALGAVVVIAAALVWALLLRSSGSSQGPLDTPGVESVSFIQHPGDEFGYGHAVAYNRGSEPAELDRIRLVDPTPGLEVIGTKVGGPNRELLSLSNTPKWPTDEFTDQRPVKG